MKFRTIGIIGGMGPEATVALYGKVIRIFQEEYRARDDADFPEIIIINLPIPDVVGRMGDERVTRQMLVCASQRLEKAGADFIAVPCNTVTCFLPEMQQSVSVSFINIVEETGKYALKHINTSVGILGTEMTLTSGVYGAALEGIELILPTAEQQRQTTEVILSILAGKKKEEDRELIAAIIKDLLARGAEKVILGCTELPLLISTQDTLDTLEILARAVVKRAIDI